MKPIESYFQRYGKMNRKLKIMRDAYVTLRKEKEMTVFIKRFLPRFRSWALWLSISALIVFCVKQFAGIDISDTVDSFMNVLLPVLVAFGIINNPTDKTSI